MIREANQFDLNRLTKFSKDFAIEAGVTDYVPWNEEASKAFILSLIENPDGLVLIGEDSIMLGLVLAHPFNPNVKIFTEFAWRAKDGNGLRMLRYAEKFSKERGATLCTMMSMGTIPETDKLYERLGYTLTEKTFVKEL